MINAALAVFEPDGGRLQNVDINTILIVITDFHLKQQVCLIMYGCMHAVQMYMYVCLSIQTDYIENKQSTSCAINNMTNLEYRANI